MIDARTAVGVPVITTAAPASRPEQVFADAALGIRLLPWQITFLQNYYGMVRRPHTGVVVTGVGS